MILAILAGVTIVAAAGWGAGALWFQSPRGGAWRALSVACWLALAGAALLGLALEHAAPLWLFGAALLGLLAWWRLGCGRPMRAAGCPKWRGRRAATSTATGSRCTTCAISTGARAATTTCAGAPRPRSVASGIGGCRAVVLGRPAIAHALVSFGFGDGRHVVFSVEVRRKLGDAFSEIGASSASTSCRCWRPPKRTACGYAPMCAARTVTCIACTCPRAGARVVPGLCRDGQRAGASTALLQHADRQLHHHRTSWPGASCQGCRWTTGCCCPAICPNTCTASARCAERTARGLSRRRPLYRPRARTADAAQFSRNIRQGVPGE